MMFGVSIVINTYRISCLAFYSTLPCAVGFCGRLIGGVIVECCNNVCSSWTFSSFEAFFTKCGVKSAVATASINPSTHPPVCPCLPDLVSATVLCVRFSRNSVPEFFIERCTEGTSLVKIGSVTVILYVRTWMNFRPLVSFFFSTGGRYSVQNIFTWCRREILSFMVQ